MTYQKLILEKVIREVETVIPIGPGDIKGCLQCPRSPEYFQLMNPFTNVDRGVTHRKPELRDHVEIININRHKKRWLNNA